MHKSCEVEKTTEKLELPDVTIRGVIDLGKNEKDETECMTTKKFTVSSGDIFESCGTMGEIGDLTYTSESYDNEEDAAMAMFRSVVSNLGCYHTVTGINAKTMLELFSVIKMLKLRDFELKTEFYEDKLGFLYKKAYPCDGIIRVTYHNSQNYRYICINECVDKGLDQFVCMHKSYEVERMTEKLELPDVTLPESEDSDSD